MSEEWYYQQGGQRIGPVTLEALRSLLQSGRIDADELVWAAPMPEWQPASRVEPLANPAASAGGRSAGGGSAGAGSAGGGAPSRAPSPRSEATPLGVLPYSMPQVDALTFTPRAMEMLRQTKPWARLIGVLIFIGAAFMILAGVAMMAGMVALGGVRGGGPPAVIVGVLYIAMAALYLAPAIYLNRYASRIGELMHLNRADVLENALEAQKSFWKFVGIVAAIIMSLYAVGILIFILIAVTR